MVDMEHTKYKCKQPCTTNHCPICDGGLFWCAECGLAEGELTTECPGFKVDMDVAEKCYNGKLDFIDGDWLEL